MKRKIITIASLVVLALVLGGFTMSILFPNNRSHYKIYEEDGEYYYKNSYCLLNRTWNEKKQIAFEDDLALISEYKTAWGITYTITLWKFIDKNGKVVLRPDVYLADAFSDGLAAIMPFEGSNWGYINKNGEIVIEPQFTRASMFKDGFASVHIENDGGKWVLINKNGEYVQDLDEPLNWKSYSQADPKNDLP